jgi:uncharacterized protein (DUF1697 family)
MPKYIALLRGVNVGGNNKISMPELKAAFESEGFSNVTTYINSGNIIFDADEADETALKSTCEAMIVNSFGLNIIVNVISAADFCAMVAHAPPWWNSDLNCKHNAIFVIPPMTAENACGQVGAAKPVYEQIAHWDRLIFWSAPLATFSHTRWSKVVGNKAVYLAVTIRNANTTVKLAALAKKEAAYDD